MPFTIIRNDITKMDVDVIVNTANEEPIFSNGVDTAVYEAAGVDELLHARREIGRLKQGDVVITPGFKLKAKYIIHAVSPYYYDGSRGEADKLRLCYENSLKLAQSHGCESIAFPLISTGNYGYPKQEAMRIALNVISSFLLNADMMVYLVVFDDESVRMSGKLFKDIESYIDENYVKTSLENEYLTADKFGHSVKPLDYDVVVNGRFNTSMIEAAISNGKENFREKLFSLIDERQYTDVYIYKKANLDRRLFHKIKTDEKYQPSKATVIAFAIALELDITGTEELLKTAGYALSAGSQYDLIIRFFIERRIYDIYKINSVLFDYGEKCFGC